MLSTLYNVEINTINYHIKKIYNDKELTEDSTIRKFRIIQDQEYISSMDEFYNKYLEENKDEK